MFDYFFFSSTKLSLPNVCHPNAAAAAAAASGAMTIIPFFRVVLINDRPVSAVMASRKKAVKRRIRRMNPPVVVGLIAA